MPGCQACHSEIQLDSAHDLACTDCHQGNNATNDQGLAHQGMISQAASPANMQATCGTCHPEQLQRCGQSGHFSMRNAVNLVREHFSLSPLNNLTEIPENEQPPQTKEELVNDLLRRQCLRCHVYSTGDNYPYVRHGTGCAACHLQYTEGKLTSSGEGKENHAFLRPNDRQCLSCHYGNHVGMDFYGGHEQDHDWSYRTPFATRAPFLRPYGIELHNLAPDIHQQRGMTCLDCHNGTELAGESPSVQCVDCHAPDGPPALASLRTEGEKIFLTLQNDKKERLVPRLQHPAHAKYKDQVTCQVCHAQWTFHDRATHLLLSYSDDADAWERLAVQSNAEVERFVEHNMYSEEDLLAPSLPDQLNGQRKAGIWYTGFSTRRWENILIRKDTDGIIKVFRPILDLQLSAVDEDDEVLADFDNLTGKDEGLLPYTPHTTGPAGLFYQHRFLHLLPSPDAERANNQ
ncbi:MAG: hypothetical protein WGN25_07765 [Candidatus Electrothrix sp. GW3-4]|uniref:hypothetical protein n=1 Tax=Candidatus Electrothrix sp. GW3-4 TaxID=3126740 RepID=UPI0030CC100B